MRGLRLYFWRRVFSTSRSSILVVLFAVPSMWGLQKIAAETILKLICILDLGESRKAMKTDTKKLEKVQFFCNYKHFQSPNSSTFYRLSQEIEILSQVDKVIEKELFVSATSEIGNFEKKSNLSKKNLIFICFFAIKK